VAEDSQFQSSESPVDGLVRDLYTTALGFDWELEPEDIVGPSRRPGAKRVPRRVGAVLVAAAILVVFFVPFPHLSVFDRLGHRPSAVSTSGPKTQLCKIGQLRITYYGESAAAGTAITSFKVTNASKVACVLSGYPTVQFFTGTTSAPRPFAVEVSHDGPGIAFASHPRPVVLAPSGSSASAGKAAGLLFTSGDFAADGSGNCPQVTSIVVRLRDSGRGTRVFLWYPTNVCRSPASANVSSFFPASSLDPYALPTIIPWCTMSDLSVSIGEGDAGLGHVGMPILFRNVTVIPCGLSSYPSVGLLGASGRRVATAKDTPSGYLGGLASGTTSPPVIDLPPGQTASALVEALDSNSSGAACPTYPTVLVSLPASAQAVAVEHAFNGCSDLQVHPFIRGRTGSVAQAATSSDAAAKVAVVDAGSLFVVDEATGEHLLLARGASSQLGSDINTPAFSADGDWVAYLEQVGGSPSSLHVTRSSGGAVVTIPGVLSYSWSPRRDELAASLPDAVELLSPTGTVFHRWTLARPWSQPVFSPSGDEIAIGSSTTRVPVEGGSLVVVRVSGGPARTVVAFRAHVCQIPVSWTVDGSYILSWQNEGCSASIAADGALLESVPAKSGPPVPLGWTLPYPSWVVPVSGTRLLVNEGVDRIAADHKTLRSCDAATGKCQTLALPVATSTVDPALARAGDELLEVRVRQSVQINGTVADGTIWQGDATGKHERELSSAGTGVADPVPSPGGSTVTFVRMTSAGKATVDLLTVRTGVVSELAPVDDDDYYGEFEASAVLSVWQPVG
jgi:Tol biopolymer transport system component